MYQIASQRLFMSKNFRGGGSMLPDPSRKLVAFGPSGLLPQNDIKSEIEPCLHVSAVA